MLFRRDDMDLTAAEGAEAPEKTGMRRFLEILQEETAALLKLNLLFLVSCIPVVTIPPALLALHQLCRRAVVGDAARGYWKAFKAGWKKGYGAFLVMAVPMVLAGYGAVFYLSRAASHPMMFLPFMLCATVFLTVMLSTGYLYGLLCSGRPLREALRSALVLGLGKPLRGVLAALCWYGLTAAAVLAFPISGAYLVLIGFSLPCVLEQFYVRTVLRDCCGCGDAS